MLLFHVVYSIVICYAAIRLPSRQGVINSVSLSASAITYNESLNQKVPEGASVMMHCGPKVNPGNSYFWIKDFNYFGPHLPMNSPLQVCMTTVKILVFSRRTYYGRAYATVLRLSSVVCTE